MPAVSRQLVSTVVDNSALARREDVNCIGWGSE